MAYVFGILLPPVGLLLAGRPFQAVLSFALFLLGLVTSVFFGIGLLFWLAAVVWSCAAIHDRRVRRRGRKLVREIGRTRGLA